MAGMTDGATSATIEAERTERAEWPEDVRELAFEVWMLQAGQNASQVARILAGDYAVRVSARTVQDWERRYEWARVKVERLAEFAPAIRDDTAGILTVNAWKAAKLQQRHLTDLERGLPLPPDAKTSAGIIRDAIILGGFSPTGNYRPEPKPPKRALAELPDLTGMDSDQLEALLREQQAQATT
jgi:hypothetical protein